MLTSDTALLKEIEWWLQEAPAKLTKLRSGARDLLGELTSILRRLRKSL